MQISENGFLSDFQGLGTKIAFSMNPGKLISNGWNAMTEGAHAATSAGARGWVGNSAIGRHLPVGQKTWAAGFTALGAPDAFAKEDPSGEGQSRGERIGRWAGSNLGMVAGTLGHGITSKLGPKKGFVAGIGANIGGMVAGEYLGGKIGQGANRVVNGPQKVVPQPQAMQQ